MTASNCLWTLQRMSTHLPPASSPPSISCHILLGTCTHLTSTCVLTLCNRMHCGAPPWHQHKPLAPVPCTASVVTSSAPRWLLLIPLLYKVSCAHGEDAGGSLKTRMKGSWLLSLTACVPGPLATAQNILSFRSTSEKTTTITMNLQTRKVKKRTFTALR